MFDTLIGVVMKAKSLAALLVACASTLAVPSFAGGYGSASSSDYSAAHAPVSHHAQTVRPRTMKHEQGSMDDQNQGDVGGDEFTRSQSGHREPSDTLDPMYHGG
ncbi:hypothetical protein GCT13_20760 [Paraburkholderia sp. CNPSo 3157]|uniref:Lipoprotein n=1 Tax=Paraburkholderia franconis TaxID=2654983 RepID=A0A7X1NCY2_9BURK|nr:hypothetical protein [Paraburkholderia franconis]MPW19261.1 hypothetical protein [Paraburkholderia franconis]